MTKLPADHQACAAVHAAAQPCGVRFAGHALGGELHECECRADGHAPAIESQFQYVVIFSGEPGDFEGAATIRNDHGGQRLLDVFERRAGQPLGQ